MTKSQRTRVNNQLIFYRIARTYLETGVTEKQVQNQLDQVNYFLEKQSELWAEFKAHRSGAKQQEHALTDFEKIYGIKVKLNQRIMLNFILNKS